MLKDPSTRTANYVIGEYAEPTPSPASLAERKTPPLASVLSNSADFLQISPDSHFKPEYVDLEWDKLWTKTWLCAGRFSDVATKGSWFRYEIGRESIIIVGDGGGAVNAFYNVCQHRGNRLVDGDFGKVPIFVCPYHSWGYDLAGRCKHVTDRDLFKPDALSGNLDIPTIRTAMFGGFVWINMSNDPRSLEDYLGDVATVVKDYPLDDMQVRADVTIELECNWKIILEAFSEAYHVHITHPSVSPVIEDKYSQMDFYPNGHSRRIVPVGNMPMRSGNRQDLHPLQRSLLVSVGIDPDTFAGGPRGVRRAVQQAKRQMSGPAAPVYAKLTDNQLTDDWATNIFPNMHWSMHAEGVLVLRYTPHRSDPGKCVLHILTLSPPDISFDFYFPPAKDVDASGRPLRVRLTHDSPDAAAFIGQSLHEDFRNTRETQLGLQSRGFNRIRLSEYEQPIMYQYSEIKRYLDRE